MAVALESGTPCPPPELAIEPAASPHQIRLHWPTWAAGYELEGRPAVHAGAWTTGPQEPVVQGGRLNVTNSSSVPPERYYRLHKPQ